jgi:hypothetical protein
MDNYGKTAIQSVIAGVIAGLVIGIILFIVSALIPTVELPAALIGFWSGVVVALLTFCHKLGWI